MGGKVWSVNEERVFWRIIVPQSQKRIGTGPAPTKTWEELALLMQSLMGVDSKRTYSHLSLFEHFFQNIDKARVSPNAGVFVHEYQQAVNRTLKATEKERDRETELDEQSNDEAAMVNVYQDNDSQDGIDLSYSPSEVTGGDDKPADEFEDENGATEGDKENQHPNRFQGERARYRAPHSSLYSPAPKADNGPGNEYSHGIPVQASPPAERLILGDIRQPGDQALADDEDPYTEASEMQIRSYGSAPSRTLKHRNNHRVHPYGDVKPQRHGRNPQKGYDRVHSQALQGNSAYYAASGSHHSSHGYYTPIEFSHVPPEYYDYDYDYGYHGENFHPYAKYRNHTQSAPSHSMVFYDQAPGHFHGSYGYEPHHPTLHGFSDFRDCQFPDRNSLAITANYDSSESHDSSWASYDGHSYGLMEGDWVSSKSRSSAVRDCAFFNPENIQRPASSVSNSKQLVSQAHHRGRHSGSYTTSPLMPAEELERQWMATLEKEFGPFKMPDQRQA
ncbi:hypothetical protein CSUB01_04959 [Colletotrichum sublineola]|uniref:Uncharacterized protein n=1 Tax=Colletotrichum sublineola TaxID=1173701 RepID=A0A066XBR2_COLSU|nr:hypothetical protein CSUB01_04959 [Colletotrichum sublineola]